MRKLAHFLTIIAALFVFSLPAAASQRAIIILDASGSMWAQIDGKTRIEIARDTLGQVLAGVPAELELGFMAYGHRTKGDCSDIEMLVEPEAGTADRIIGAAMSLNPRGKTPLSDAVRQAAEALKYTEDQATVVLITDGIETCNADPCALATELEAAGVDFTVNVVGFGLSEADGAAVKCLADNTGGTYIGADDADALKDAIDVAVNETPVPEPTPQPEPTPPPQPDEPVSTINFDPSAILAEGEDPLVAGDGDIAWEFAKPNADGTPGEWVRTQYGNEYEDHIEPGDYVVTARIDSVSVTQRVLIEDGKVAKPMFNLDAGQVTIRPFAYTGAAEPDYDAMVNMKLSNGGDPTSYGPIKWFVPAGPATVTIGIGVVRHVEEINIVAGERANYDMIVGIGRANVSTFYVEGMMVEEDVFVRILGSKKDIQGNREDFGSTYGPETHFDLLPGDYVALVEFDRAKAEQPFTIKEGEASDVGIVFNAGVLAVTTTAGDYIQIFSAKKDIQGNRIDFGATYDTHANRTLPAGDYIVAVSTSGVDGAKETPATVVAGERTELSVD